MLSVDRDLDEDRTFEYVVARHDDQECPRAFLPSDDESALRLRSAAPASTFQQ
jgi:hypothetical protein